MTTTNADIQLFFDGRPAAMKLYSQIEENLLAAFPDMRIRPQKTQITFANVHNFACVSLPRRKSRDRRESIVVSFGLAYRAETPRIEYAVEAYRNRWTHHVSVSSADDIDAELMAWLAEAYRFSASK